MSNDEINSFDLEAYLTRIGYSGEVASTFDTLSGLIRAHMDRIPYENLDVLLGRPIRLDLDSCAFPTFPNGNSAAVGYPTARSSISAAVIVFCSSIAMVIGPTPPGTGVM